MNVFIVFEKNGSEKVVPMKLPGEESRYEDFLKIILAVSGMPADQQYEVAINGKLWTKADIVKAGGTIKSLCLKENDRLVYRKQATASSSLAPVKLEVAGSSDAEKVTDHMLELERFIALKARRTFDNLCADVSDESSEIAMPGIIAAFEANRDNFEQFLIIYQYTWLQQKTVSLLSEISCVESNVLLSSSSTNTSPGKIEQTKQKQNRNSMKRKLVPEDPESIEIGCRGLADIHIHSLRLLLSGMMIEVPIRATSHLWKKARAVQPSLSKSDVIWLLTCPLFEIHLKNTGDHDWSNAASLGNNVTLMERKLAEKMKKADLNDEPIDTGADVAAAIEAQQNNSTGRQ